MHSVIHTFVGLCTIWSFIFSTPLYADPPRWQPRGAGGGGALFSPSINPHDNDEIFLACDMTEIFHTTDGGVSWSTIPFVQLIAEVESEVQFTEDPSIMYTINSKLRNDDVNPVKSTNSGITWAPLKEDPTGGSCWRIFADPNDHRRLIISDYRRLFFSFDGGNSFSTKFSTEEGLYIPGVFWDGNYIYVGTGIGLLLSKDNGATFKLEDTPGIPSELGFMDFSGAKKDDDVRLIGTVAYQEDLYPGVTAEEVEHYQGLYKRDYKDTRWSEASGGIKAEHKIFHVGAALNDPNIFYAAGTDVETSFPVVYRTTDGGASWSEVFLPKKNKNIITGWSGYKGDKEWSYGEIVFGLAVAPNDPNRVVITDYGFPHITTDGGLTWRQMYVSRSEENPPERDTPKGKSYRSNGLENTTSWWIIWINDQRIFASYSDLTGLLSIDGGVSWSFDYKGNDYNSTYHIIKHPVTGILYAAVSSVHDMYQSTYIIDSRIDEGKGAILFSDDDGMTWRTLHDFGMPVVFLAFDPADSNIMYASVVHSKSGGIYKTVDLTKGPSSSWSKTASPARTEGHPFNVYVLDDATVVSTWSARRDGEFTASSGVFLSSDGGRTWLDRSAKDEMHYWTKDITIDPHDSGQNTWYVTVFSAWGERANDRGGVYRTTNRGQTWTKIHEEFRVESISVNPKNRDEAYLATEDNGLHYTSNLTAELPTFTRDRLYPFAHPTRIFFNPFDSREIWVTSFGNGMRVWNR